MGLPGLPVTVREEHFMGDPRNPLAQQIMGPSSLARVATSSSSSQTEGPTPTSSAAPSRSVTPIPSTSTAPIHPPLPTVKPTPLPPLPRPVPTLTPIQDPMSPMDLSMDNFEMPALQATVNSMIANQDSAAQERRTGHSPTLEEMVAMVTQDLGSDSDDSEPSPAPPPKRAPKREPKKKTPPKEPKTKMPPKEDKKKTIPKEDKKKTIPKEDKKKTVTEEDNKSIRQLLSTPTPRATRWAPAEKSKQETREVSEIDQQRERQKKRREEFAAGQKTPKQDSTLFASCPNMVEAMRKAAQHPGKSHLAVSADIIENRNLVASRRTAKGWEDHAVTDVILPSQDRHPSSTPTPLELMQQAITSTTSLAPQPSSGFNYYTENRTENWSQEALVTSQRSARGNSPFRQEEQPSSTTMRPILASLSYNNLIEVRGNSRPRGAEAAGSEAQLQQQQQSQQPQHSVPPYVPPYVPHAAHPPNVHPYQQVVYAPYQPTARPYPPTPTNTHRKPTERSVAKKQGVVKPRTGPKERRDR